MSAPVRLVELLAPLSLAGDAADGFVPETTIRSAVIAGTLAVVAGHPELAGEAVLGGLIRHIGCTGFAVEEAHHYGAGDDVALRRTMAAVDLADPHDAARRIEEGFAPDAAPADRQRGIDALFAGGPAVEAAHHAAQCDAGERLADLLPLPAGSCTVAAQAFEHWDGTGGPGGLAGDDISAVARLVEVAYRAELFRSRYGRKAALDALRSMSGRQLDPAITAAFTASSDDVFSLVDDPSVSAWDRLLDAEPEPHHRVSAAQADDVSVAFARFTDLKSTWFVGHSEAVAALAEAAAPALGIGSSPPDGGGTDDLTRLRRAARLHDIGRVGIATGTWDLPRRLSRPERGRVEGHSLETLRILSATSLLAEVAELAGSAHERLDASGYHRSRRGTDLEPAARLLAVADVAVALSEERPHRPAHSPGDAAALLAGMAHEGRLDPAAVQAVLDAGPGPVPVSVSWPSGLTDREVEVLRLVARGASNKEVARRLGITAKTVAHHVAHVYDKTGCRSRSGATLFALDAGLIGPGSPLPTL